VESGKLKKLMISNILAIKMIRKPTIMMMVAVPIRYNVAVVLNI